MRQLIELNPLLNTLHKIFITFFLMNLDNKGRHKFLTKLYREGLLFHLSKFIRF